MVTKRMMLAAGALTLALSVGGCSEDRAGGATGPGETSSAAARAAPVTPLAAPLGVAVPSGDGTIPGPALPSDEAVRFEADGHQYSILVVPGADGGDVTRIVQDGATLVEVAGTPASLATATSADITLFFQGQAVFSDVVSLQGNALASIPEQFRGAPVLPGGPMLQKAFPCAAQMGAFGAAAAFLSLELYMARYSPGSVSWRELWAAGAAVVGTGIALFNCLASHW
jgi:hypothetical protein